MFLFFSSVVDPAASQTAPSMSEADRVQFGRDTLALAFELLRTRGVPFDPELLIDRDWRSELAPALELMPEMRETLHVTGPMNGVYLADTVLLGTHVTLAGDTFILAREFAPDDENAIINISGDAFVIHLCDRRSKAKRSHDAQRSRLPNAAEHRRDVSFGYPGDSTPLHRATKLSRTSRILCHRYSWRTLAAHHRHFSFRHPPSSGSRF